MNGFVPMEKGEKMRLVDADAATRALDNVLAEELAPAEVVLINFAKSIVSGALTVDPFIHTSWKREIDEFGCYWSCSNCGNFSYHGKTRYCPHCGAKMDEDKIDRVKVSENEEDKGHAAGGRG